MGDVEAPPPDETAQLAKRVGGISTAGPARPMKVNKYAVITKYLGCYPLAILGGCLLPFAFAPYRHGWLVWPSLLCLLYSLDHLTPKRAVLNGLLFGLCYFGIGVQWLTHSIHIYGHAPLLLAMVITALLVCVLASFTALLSWLMAKLSVTAPLLKSVSFASGWTLFEIIRSVLFTGFPWLLLGYSQTDTNLSTLAPLIGVYGISFVVCFVGALGYYALSQRTHRLRMIIGLGVLLLFILSSHWVAKHHTFVTPYQKPLDLTLVQGSVSQAIKWSPQHSAEIVKQYENLSKNHWQNRVVIWPEAAIPLAKQSIEPWLQQLALTRRTQHSTLITGIPIFNEQKQAFYNSLIALGEFEGRYDKHHLVPFGEYTPLHRLFSWFMRWIDIPMSDEIPGVKNQPLLTLKDIRIAPFICYEIAFSSQVYRHLPRANLLLVISDDSWFGHSSAAAQHLQIATMRALETGRPVAFVTNGGLSAVITPQGKLQAVTPAYQSAVIETTVQGYTGQTFLLTLGQPRLLLLLLLFVLCCSVQSIVKFLSGNSQIKN